MNTRLVTQPCSVERLRHGKGPPTTAPACPLILVLTQNLQRLF